MGCTSLEDSHHVTPLAKFDKCRTPQKIMLLSQFKNIAIPSGNRPEPI